MLQSRSMSIWLEEQKGSASQPQESFPGHQTRKERAELTSVTQKEIRGYGSNAADGALIIDTFRSLFMFPSFDVSPAMRMTSVCAQTAQGGGFGFSAPRIGVASNKLWLLSEIFCFIWVQCPYRFAGSPFCDNDSLGIRKGRCGDAFPACSSGLDHETALPKYDLRAASVSQSVRCDAADTGPGFWVGQGEGSLCSAVVDGTKRTGRYPSSSYGRRLRLGSMNRPGFCSPPSTDQPVLILTERPSLVQGNFSRFLVYT